MAVLPSLSLSGWVDTVDGKADRLMSYFFTSQYSQTYTYHRNIASLPYLIATYGHDVVNLRSTILSTLSDLFFPYFDEVDFNVDIEVENDVVIHIRVSAIFEEDGTRYDLARLIDVNNGSIGKIVKLNNG